ncbi:MAG TPA: HAMP domain-containing sensor histidine kinase [Gammaproteobacteria bacterium]|nr:HAMP domain-containing sensor histidine kinase [Gammaproteobacteria bacterium]
MPDTTPRPIERALPWRLLHLLNLFRMMVGGLVVVLYFSDTGARQLGAQIPLLFLWTGIAYFCFSAVSSFAVRAQHPALFLQIYSQMVADVVAVTLLMHSSGGTNSGLGGLLFISIAVNSVILSRRMGIAFAAFATLALLSEQTFTVLYGPSSDASYIQTGIIGIILFAAALAGHALGHRLRESEALAERRGIDLENLAQLNAHIIGRMRTGIVVVDQDNRVRLANNSALASFGATRAEGLGLNTLSTRLQHALDSWRADSYRRNATVLAADERPIIPHFARLASGQDSATLIFLEDASQMAEQVRQMKLAALGRLTGSIAHEVRNPLAAISHANQLLAESPRLEAGEQRLTEIISEHALRMERMVETILQLSRRDSSRAEELELGKWLRDFATEFRERRQLAETSLAVAGEAPDALRVRVDPAHLHQILWNLTENSLRHGQAGPDGAASMIEFRILASSRPGRIELDILDRGPGVPAEIAEHIFEPFYTSNPRGTGLGLFIARELCECNHARLIYEPRSGGGSCFRILFNTPEGWFS